MATLTKSYFTFDVNGRRTGLIRRTETDTELTLERMDPAGTWIDDPGLVRHFRDSVDLVSIGKSEAEQLAEQYGGQIKRAGRSLPRQRRPAGELAGSYGSTL